MTGNRLAHRVAWEKVHGPIPQGMQVLHRCDTPLCVNVEHLFLGTNADNQRDKASKGRVRNQYSDKDTCLRGHPWKPETTRIRASRPGVRECKVCARERRS
jgi:hypothetical protein